MGLSSNQARFLSLTSRQVDLEHRIQQICQRRLRLSSELEKVSTAYNNSISNRKMFTTSTAGLQSLSLNGLKSIGYKLIDATTKTLANAPMKAITQISESTALGSGYDSAHIIHNAAEFVSKVTSDLSGNFILTSDIDMSELGTLSASAINGVFSGNFDGNGYVISNLNISSSGLSNVGLFSTTSAATIQNVSLENVNINTTGGSYTGGLVGYNGNSLIDNCYVTGNISSAGSWTGGISGSNESGGVISNCYTTTDIAGNDGTGGITGASANGNNTISNCFTTGNITGDMEVGGIAGVNRDGNSIIQNSYSTSNVSGTNFVGGIAGGNYNVATMSPLPNQVINSYSANCSVTGGANVGGVVGYNASGSTQTNSFYYNNGQSWDAAGAVNGNTNPFPTGSWSTSIWDLTTSLPSLKMTGGISQEKIEEGLRNGKYSLAREADEFTQEPLTLNGDEYQEIDWRSVPELNDELYKGDDVYAENKYDKAIEEINAQDKKLQLEQTSVEVEYKAISSERESVKKILDTNAQSSFKYFS